MVDLSARDPARLWLRQAGGDEAPGDLRTGLTVALPEDGAATIAGRDGFLGARRAGWLATTAAHAAIVAALLALATRTPEPWPASDLVVGLVFEAPQEEAAAPTSDDTQPEVSAAAEQPEAAPPETAPPETAAAETPPPPLPAELAQETPPEQTAALPSEPPPAAPLPEPAPAEAPPPEPVAAPAPPAAPAEPPPLPQPKPRLVAKPASPPPAPAPRPISPPSPAAAASAPVTAALPAASQLAAVPVIPPRPVSAAEGNRKPDYPAEARRRGYGGTVVLRVGVTATGAAEDVVVLRSSGHDILDEAALTAVRRWRFHAATRNGEAVAAPVDVPIRFRLEE